MALYNSCIVPKIQLNLGIFIALASEAETRKPRQLKKVTFYFSLNNDFASYEILSSKR
jgi:hypothetical protein